MSDDTGNTGKRKVMTVTPAEMMNPLTRRQLLRAAALSGSALLLTGLVNACHDYTSSPSGPTAPGAKPLPLTQLSGGDQFLSEIRIFSFNFAPRGWSFCNGQILAINTNQALFSLLGTTYGGNGQTTFALPDLRGRAPIHQGNGHFLGERAGQEFHTVSLAEMPSHSHDFMATSAKATVALPAGNILGAANNLYVPDIIPDPDADRMHAALVAAPSMYASGTVLTTLHPGTIAATGSSQAHENRQPYSVLNFCIALQGIFPSPN
jgi:microcystin-dependent protein